MYRLRGAESRGRAIRSGRTQWTLSNESSRISARFTAIAPMATTRPWRAAWRGWATDEVLVIGNRKGGSTKERVRRNFGMPHPEGYRKALRCMKIAEKFGRPVISLIDLPGAYPGLGAEERGQAEAIARNIREMARLRVPTISVISGEGGSGGALALAVSDRVLILENALYFVITPESCAAIMWRDAAQKQLAAEAMRISAPEVSALGCVDEIISEPPGGVHIDHETGAGLLGTALQEASGRTEEHVHRCPGCRPPGEVPQDRPVLYGRLALLAHRLLHQVGDTRDVHPATTSQCGSTPWCVAGSSR